MFNDFIRKINLNVRIVVVVVCDIREEGARGRVL